MADFLILSAAVAANLDGAEAAEGMNPGEAKAVTTVAGEEHHTADPALFAVLNGTVWVSIAMIVFIAIVVWKGGVRAITAMLDRQIADIRRQLDEAQALRAEAEALRDDYARRIADAEKNAAEMTAQAEHAAEGIVAKAKADAAELVARRARMAEDKIAAAERAAIAEVRETTAAAATRAAAALIAERHDAGADRTLVDRTIAGLSRPN